MTCADVSRKLRYMEHIREMSYECDTKKEERRLVREYGALWNIIEPYVSGKLPYDEEKANV